MSLLSTVRAKMARARRSRDADKRGGPAPEPRADNLFYTCDTAPIYYLSITKCGCTFVKHLLYRLDHGEDHPSGVHIHEENTALARVAAGDLDAVSESPYCFTVLRDPVARFTSLYFDKIAGTGPTSFPQVREHLMARGVIAPAEDGDVEIHQQNARNFIGWLEQNLAGQTELGLNYHWRRQTSRLRRGRGFPVQCLTLDGLDWQLPKLVGPVLPNIAEQMAAVTERNVSRPPIAAASILDDALIGHIHTVYGQDWVNYEKARARWAPFAPEMTPHPAAPVPLIGHHRVLVTAGVEPRPVTGAMLSGIERLDGTVQDFANGSLSARGVVLVRDPVDRFLEATMTLGSDGKMHINRYGRARRRSQQGGQWPLEPQTPEQILGAVASFVGIIRKLPGLLARHGLDPQQPYVQAALDKGMRPVCGADPVNAGGLPMSAAQDARLEMWREALTPELAEVVRNLYRADFELYERLQAEGA
ncbi:sulfotransferase family 2 domain-containing protein [Pontivivens insulae]|uniref:Sulfotransferase family protein n=1 Tax=Pontivivens insulae TaxID=1639689 RepID=A0A2R8AEZ5_9RHOB|nr:sulfotransferase family 2 domain-containing protein [Pontivivens insulae]RED12065.1 sulfotransferase family protein [Pontivivens insulae]SPF30821.1 hypothetical protein POI8812_03165 [Pontivivens insulae]